MSRSARRLRGKIVGLVKIDGAQFSCDGQQYGYLVIAGVEAPLAELTPAEREVVQLVASGCSNREIAQRRRASVHTVGNQLAAIYGKLGVSSRHELVARLSRSAQ
jgi:DNA-binding CsgD family transcriptional regulator